MIKMGMSYAYITPPVGAKIDGFAAREPSSTGVSDSLKAISLVVSDGETKAALVSCDLLDVDANLVKEIRAETSKRTSIPRKNISVVCTHTHYGPTVSKFNVFFKGSDDIAAYRAGLKFYIAGTIYEACANMQPTIFGAGLGTSSIGVNRRERQLDGRITIGQNRGKPVDRQAGVMKFLSSDGKPLACIVNFACHPVCQTWASRFVSADYPGKTRQVIETLTGARCMFLQGACGNINPVLMELSYEPARRSGTQLGCEVVKVWEDIGVASAESMASASETIELPRYDYGSKERAEEYVADLRRETEELKAQGSVEGMINWARIRLRRATEASESWNSGKPLPKVKAEIQAWRIGDNAIVFVPGEVFNEIGTHIKQHSSFPSTFFVGYANGNVGYIPTREAYAEGGYEVNDACQVGPEAACLVTEKCLGLLELLYEKT